MKQCPYCDKKFEKLRDFPLIKIIKFERLKLPEIIGHFGMMTFYDEKKVLPHERLELFLSPLPEEALKSFEESGRDIVLYEKMVFKKTGEQTKNGTILYEGGKDITEIVNKTTETSQVQETFKALENLVGKEIEPKQLLSLPAFTQFEVGKYKDFSLLLRNSSKKDELKNDLRINTLSLVGDWDGMHISDPISGEDLGNYSRYAFPKISCNLAELYFEGRLRRPAQNI